MKIRYLFILALIGLGILHLSSQDRKELEEKRKSLNHQIRKSSQLLKKAIGTHRAELKELNALRGQIDSRRELLSTTYQEIAEIDKKVEEKRQVIKALEEDLDQLEKNYHNLLLGLYRTYQAQTPSKLTSLIPNGELDENKQQWTYLKQLHNQRHEQINYIQAIQLLLNDKVKLLNEKRLSKAKLVGEAIKQQDELSENIAQKNRILEQLKNKETQLRRQIAEKEKAKRHLNKRIEGTIKAEIATVKKASRSYNSIQQKNARIQNTKFSKDFVKNKGKLPMPIYKGTVVAPYGRQVHAVFEQVVTENNGIDIKTSANEQVKAVHDGEIVTVFSVPGSGKALILKHGDYYTTYSNLAKVTVKSRQKVKRGQKVGTVSKDSKSGHYILHFELWRGKQKENPSHWLR